jgi:hypothetical protein
MRRLYLTVILLVVVSHPAQAGESPIDPGSVVPGGFIYLERTTGKLHTDMTTLSIHPRVMVFVKRGFAIGANLLYNQRQFSSGRITAISVGPQIGYFVDTSPSRDEAGGKVMPFVMLFGNFSYDHYKYWDVVRSWGRESIDIGGSAGTAIFLSNTMSLDVSLLAVHNTGFYEPRNRHGWTFRLGMGLSGYIY